MARRIYLNNISTRLTATLAAAGLTANVTAGDGASFVLAAGGDWIIATLVKVSGYREIAREIVKITARSTDALTIVRAQESTAALDFAVGDVLEVRATSLSFTKYAFFAYNSATDANVTGNATAATVDFDTEVFDYGSNFAADTFTAPVTGTYRFSALVRGVELTNATSISLSLVTSNRTYLLSYDASRTIAGAGDMTTGGSTLADMDAGDTAYITYAVNGIGANTADIWGGAAVQTYFSGELVC